MKKFYGDIETIRCDYLLKATPYTKENTDNFGGRLDKKTFFTYLYTERDHKPSASTENDLFDKKVDNAMQDLGNEFAKVGVLHISGYAGCGKTTYIHHLLWTKKDEIGRYDIIDYEGSLRVVDPFIRRTAYLLGNLYNIEDVCSFFDVITDDSKDRLFDASRFVSLLPYLKDFSKELINLSTRGHADKDILSNMITSFGGHFKKQKTFLKFLFLVDFLLLLLYRFDKERKSPIVLVIDNSDSMSNLSEEETLLPVTLTFAKDCNYFFVENRDRGTSFFGKTVEHVCKNTKLQIIFTTRLATERRYETIAPDWEKINGWTSIKLPENYYDHKEVISKRVDFYIANEGLKEGSVTWNLMQIKKLTDVAYHNFNFMKLFNGSLRVCIDRLYDITQDYPTQMIQESIDLYQRASQYTNIYEGATGYFLSLILGCFKSADIYSRKLDLNPCRMDGTVTLSRIILTILREKGGRCSLLDMFHLLTPLGFSPEKIAETVWHLCETKRNVWRRLLVFEIFVPTKSYRFIEQATLYESGNHDVESYSELVMCTAGDAYLEFVLPHFEFMQSRHELSSSVIEKKYQPLFAESSEENISEIPGKIRYRFESKIERVFKDVSDCCNNSLTFAYQVMEWKNWDRDTYINRSFYNFHAIGWDGGPSPKQSYESRLIFRHVGYIEKYRRYLLKKYEKEGIEKQKDISIRLVDWIIKYLSLYQDPEKCFHTLSQDIAANNLMVLARKIKDSEKSKNYDLDTIIELD